METRSRRRTTPGGKAADDRALAATEQLPPHVSLVLERQRAIGNQATQRLLAGYREPQRSAASTFPQLARRIAFNPNAGQTYAQSRKGLLRELSSEFYYVPEKDIDALITEVDDYNAKWTPYQAYRGIATALRSRYTLPASPVEIGGTSITREEAEWYFLHNFKTMTEVVIDGKDSFRFFNTPDDNHAEDNMTGFLDRLIEERGWHEDFSGEHTLLMRINNSPCKRCAPRLYNWKYRDIFVEFTIQFANMYEKDTGFTQATTKLRSGGIVMSLVSVTGDLLPLIDKEHKLKQSEIAKRKQKDEMEQVGWARWQMEHQ